MADFPAVFAALRAMLLEHASGLTVVRDEPIAVTVQIPTDDGTSGLFGMVAIKRSYVAYHLFPLYADPQLGSGLSAALTQRRQGKSCFNFKRIEPELFNELASLTKRAAAAVA